MNCFTEYLEIIENTGQPKYKTRKRCFHNLALLFFLEHNFWLSIASLLKFQHYLFTNPTYFLRLMSKELRDFCQPTTCRMLKRIVQSLAKNFRTIYKLNNDHYQFVYFELTCHNCVDSYHYSRIEQVSKIKN